MEGSNNQDVQVLLSRGPLRMALPKLDEFSPWHLPENVPYTARAGN